MTQPNDRALQHFLEAIKSDRPRWHLDAACRGMTPDLFYPERGDSTAEARSVCQGCPVQGQCLAFAVTRNERHGIWGDTSVRQRRNLRRQVGEKGTAA